MQKLKIKKQIPFSIILTADFKNLLATAKFIILKKRNVFLCSIDFSKLQEVIYDQVCFNTRVPTQVNTNQHESTRVNTSQT